MSNLFSNNYLANKPIERAMKEFGKKFCEKDKILDIGCGRKPYAKYFRCNYIGLDPLPEVNPDIVGQAWNLPFKDNQFNGIVLNQALEHIENIKETIAEMDRVLKPGGLAIVTVPQTMKNHSAAQPTEKAAVSSLDKSIFPIWQVDYYRFTKYGLACLFKEFEIVKLKESNGYGSTMFQLINYFFSGFDRHVYFTPIFFINNCAGVALDSVAGWIGAVGNKATRKFREYIYSSLSINLILIVRKR